MQQHQLRPPKGAKKARSRVGRGDGSGRGSYSGRGDKGQNSRAGGGVRANFEGGQLPITQRLDKLPGFTNRSRREYSVVNVDRLARFPANADVTLQQIVKAGLVKDLRLHVKVLGRGQLEVPLSVEAHRFTASARKKIEDAGGSATEIP